MRAVPDLNKVVEMRYPDGTLAGRATGYELVNFYCEPCTECPPPPPGQVIPTPPSTPPSSPPNGGEGGGGTPTAAFPDVMRYVKYAGLIVGGLLVAWLLVSWGKRKGG